MLNATLKHEPNFLFFYRNENDIKNTPLPSSSTDHSSGL